MINHSPCNAPFHNRFKLKVKTVNNVLSFTISSSPKREHSRVTDTVMMLVCVCKQAAIMAISGGLYTPLWRDPVSLLSLSLLSLYLSLSISLSLFSLSLSLSLLSSLSLSYSHTSRWCAVMWPCLSLFLTHAHARKHTHTHTNGAQNSTFAQSIANT